MALILYITLSGGENLQGGANSSFFLLCLTFFMRVQLVVEKEVEAGVKSGIKMDKRFV